MLWGCGSFCRYAIDGYVFYSLDARARVSNSFSSQIVQKTNIIGILSVFHTSNRANISGAVLTVAKVRLQLQKK